MLSSSISTLFSKLSSRRFLFLSDYNSPGAPVLHESRPVETPKSRSARFKSIVASLYKLLLTPSGPNSMTTDEVTGYEQIIASDLEWWFHGPPGCDYMMRMLTGQQTRHQQQEFRFEPKSIEVVGDCVIVEGWDGDKVYWVHVWTVSDDSNGVMVITQFREYFNTCLTVKHVTGGPIVNGSIPLWRSQPGALFEGSLPGLVLAI
ncbi:Wound-induced protein 1 [Linum perenne]